MAVAVGAGFGYRQNYVQWFGLQTRFNFALGGMMFDDTSTYSDSDSTSTDTFFGMIDLDVTPFFGPFGGFYFGPIFFVGGLFPEKESVVDTSSDISISVYQFPQGLIAGVGFEMGFVLGSREQIEINLRCKPTVFTGGDYIIYGQAGVTIHFMQKH